MLEAPWHVYQVLTKRAERLADFLSGLPNAAKASHIWWGVGERTKYQASQESNTYGVLRFVRVFSQSSHSLRVSES